MFRVALAAAALLSALVVGGAAHLAGTPAAVSEPGAPRPELCWTADGQTLTSWRVDWRCTGAFGGYRAVWCRVYRDVCEAEFIARIRAEWDAG